MRKVLMLLVLSSLLQGCISLGPNASEQILGQWQTQVGQFPMVVIYAETTVQSGSNQPIAYNLDGSELTYADGGKQIRILSFPSSSEMIQLDPVTGTEHRFSRVN